MRSSREATRFIDGRAIAMLEGVHINKWYTVLSDNGTVGGHDWETHPAQQHIHTSGSTATHLKEYLSHRSLSLLVSHHRDVYWEDSKGSYATVRWTTGVIG